MNILEIAYILSGLIAVASGVPQLLQLVKLKHSGEMNLSTWILWLSTQIIAALYISTLGNHFVLMVCTSWVFYYSVMCVLIIYYRQPRFKMRATEVINDSEEESKDVRA